MMTNNIKSPCILSMLQDPSHLNPSILSEISNALLGSTLHNHQSIKQSEKAIARFQRQEGYIAYLLEIINKHITEELNETNVMLVKTAMTQLKVYVRKEWPTRDCKRQIGQNDQMYLVNSIVRTSFNISSVSLVDLKNLCLKLLKDIIEMAGLQAINLYPEVIEAIRTSLYSGEALHLLPVYLNITLGLINQDSYLCISEFSQKCTILLKQIHPLLSEFVQKGDHHMQELYQIMAESNFQSAHLQEYTNFKRKYQEIVYLTLKLFNKGICVRNMAEIRPLMFSWITVAINHIEYVDPTFTQTEGASLQKMQTGKRGSDEFNYFHGKKWAMKLLRRAVQKVLVYQTLRSEAGRTTLEFYGQNLGRIVEIFKNIWQFQWPSKIKCELLRTLIMLVEKQPHKMAKNYQDHLAYYLQEMLPPMMDLNEQREIIEQSPAEFMTREDLIETGNNIFQYQSCRLAAIRAWMTIAKVDFFSTGTCQDSKIFEKSLGLLVNWTRQPDTSPQGLRNRDSACLLLTKLERVIVGIEKYRKDMELFVNIIIKDNLEMYRNGNFMFLVRAFELAKQFSDFLNTDTTLKLKQFLEFCFENSNPQGQIRFQQMMILLRGSQAFPRIVSVQAMKHIKCDSSLAKLIVGKVFLLVKATDNEEFIEAANDILQVSLSQLGDCYKDIVNYLKGWFTTYIDKDLEAFMTVAAREYKLNYQEIARGTIHIYKTILNNVKKEDEDVHHVLDHQIIKIITFIFSAEDIDHCFHEDALDLLCAYLNHRQQGSTLHPHIVFLCRLMILRMAGLPKDIMSGLEQHHTILEEDMKRRFQEEQGMSFNRNEEMERVQYWQNVQRKRTQMLLLLQCKQPFSYGFQPYVGMTRLFIKHINHGEAIRSTNEIFKTILNEQTNHTEYLIYLANRFYGSSNSQEYQNNSFGKCFCLLMLIIYYQHHQRSNCNKRIHRSVNMFTFQVIVQTQQEYYIKNRYAKYNAQLFCLWMYQLKEAFIEYFQLLEDYNQIQTFLSNVLIYKVKYGLRELHQHEQCLRCTFGLSTLIREAARHPQLCSLLPAQTWIQIIAYAVKFGFMTTEAYADQSYEEDEDDEDDEDEEEEDVGMANSGNERGNAQKIGYLDTKLDETRQPYEADDDWMDIDEDGSQNCWDFQEVQDNIEGSPLQQQNDGVYLLTALYDLYSANHSLYNRAMQEERLGNKMLAILESNQCYSNPSHVHFKQLCQVDDWEDQQ